MINITVTSRDLAEKAAQIMAEEAMHNQNVGNARYTITIDDFDAVDWPADEITACQLFSLIFREGE